VDGNIQGDGTNEGKKRVQDAMWLSSVRGSALLSQASTGTMTDRRLTTQTRKADKVQDATDESEFIHMPETIHTRLRWIYELNSRCPIPFRSVPFHPIPCPMRRFMLVVWHACYSMPYCVIYHFCCLACTSATWLNPPRPCDGTACGLSAAFAPTTRARSRVDLRRRTSRRRRLRAG
jgi:hypothetical protein